MANVLLMCKQIVCCALQSYRVISKKSNSGIAPCTQKTPYLTCLMVVVYCQALLYTCRGFSDAKSFADGTYATLRSKQLIVPFTTNTKSPKSSAISRATISLFSIASTPFSLVISAAWPTKTLQAINLGLAFCKLSEWLNCFTSSTPLHAFFSFRASCCKFIVPMKVSEWFTFNPAKFTSISSCFFSWPTTATLTGAFWDVLGHHFSQLNHLNFMITEV